MKVAIICIVFLGLVIGYFFLPTDILGIKFCKTFSFSDLISILVAIFISFMLPHIVSESVKKRETKSDYLLKQLDNIDNSFESLRNIINDFISLHRTNKQYLSLFKKIGNDIEYFLEANKRLGYIVKKNEGLEFGKLYYKCRTEVGEDIEEKKYAEAQNKISAFQKEIKFLKENILK